MKVEVRYQSRGGNTKAVAEAIAKAAGVQAVPIGAPVGVQADVLFVGGGVYAWDIDKSLKEFIAGLNPGHVKAAAVFTTAGGMNKTGVVAAALQAKGIKVLDGSLPVKFGVRNHAWLGGNGAIALSDKQNSDIKGFVDKIISGGEL